VLPVVPTQRFIDGYQSRNERLPNFMRRVDLCEEKGSGIDRIVVEAEFFQLPAPDFKAMFVRTIVIVYGPKPFDEMDCEDRMRTR
jgi:ATP-dependent DNA helicase RecG